MPKELLDHEDDTIQEATTLKTLWASSIFKVALLIVIAGYTTLYYPFTSEGTVPLTTFGYCFVLYGFWGWVLSVFWAIAFFIATLFPSMDKYTDNDGDPPFLDLMVIAAVFQFVLSYAIQR